MIVVNAGMLTLIPSATSFVRYALMSRPMTVIIRMTVMITFIVYMIQSKFFPEQRATKQNEKEIKKLRFLCSFYFEVSLLNKNASLLLGN